MSKLERQLGEKLKKARETQSLTQKELGDLVGFDQTTISKFEKGHRCCNAIALFSLAEQLNCSTEDLNPFG